MEATGPNTRVNAEPRTRSLAAPAAASRFSGRAIAMRLVLLLVVLATIVWLVAAPSTPALIAAVSAVVAVIGWSDGPDDHLSV